ncbi:MAG: tetratricopeptide repeat protein, partial [Cyclobacteriaceae bacterium]
LEGYEEYLEVNSRADRGVLLRAGFAAYSLGQDEKALVYLKSSASDKDSVGFYSSYYLGSIYLKQNQKQLALTAFDNSRKFKADPRLAEESSFQHAKISYDLGRPDQAIDELERFLETYTSSTHTTEVKEVLSQAYVNANNYNKAIEYIEALPSRGLAINRAYQKATMLKGIELFNMEQYADAVKMFEKSLQYPVEQDYVAEASFWNGEAYSIGRKYDEAVENYLRVVGLTDYSNSEITTKTRYGLGYAYFNLQQYDRALFNFKEFVKRDSPNLSDGVLRLADCYYVTKSYPDALANYKRAVGLKSTDNDYAHLQAGVISGIQRKYTEAASELDIVLRNYPQSRFIDEAMFQRAQLDFEQGNYAAAVSGFSRLISSNKSSKFVPYAYMRRAASHYNLKDYNKTAQDYITVVDEYSSHPVANDALLPLQEALNLAGRTGEFESHLANFKNANPDAKGIEGVEYETGKNLYFSQDYQRAITNLGNYIRNYPDSPKITEAKYYQAESHYRLKENAKALAIHQEISADFTFLFASRVTARIAELQYKLGNFDKAIPVFQQLSKEASTKKDQYNAWSGLMEAYYMLAKYDSVDAYARMILEKGNVSAGAQNKASLFLGKSAMARGDYETAKDEFLNTLNSAQDEYGAEAKYLLGEIFYLSKEYKQCYETLIGLNKDFGAYTEWVGKSYLLLSDNFVAMGDLFQAKGTLKSIIENFPLENIKALAREKLKRIEDNELMKEEELKQRDSLSNNNK